MDIKKILKETIDYKSWKRKNVTLRGIKNFGERNQVYGSLGNGLYTVPLSNRAPTIYPQNVEQESYKHPKTSLPYPVWTDWQTLLLFWNNE